MAHFASPSVLNWLKQLAHFQPAPWRWPRAIRAALSVGLPFAIGLAVNDIMTGMWIAMGTLMMTTGEERGPYGRILRHLLIAAPFGAAGYLAGYLTGLPWMGTVLGMAGLAFIAGILSSYGTVLSIGCLQFLLTAAIAIGVPSIAPFWEPALLYLLGALIYAILLGFEAALFSQRPQRDALAATLSALAGLADAQAQGKAKAGTRRQVTDALRSLASVLPSQPPRPGSYSYLPALSSCDAVFAMLLATTDAATLQQAATQLRLLATAATTARPVHVGPYPQGRLALPLRALTELLTSLNAGQPPQRAYTDLLTPTPPAIWHFPDRAALQSALALGLCMGLAYATRWVNPENHWFWVPLTVGLVMKPDLGSIFARALLRTVGTLGGVILGSLILALVPKDYAFALVMGVLAGVLPWAMKRSYALQAIILTPLVLMLVDIIIPGSANTNYSLQRLADTMLGGAIVMIFGYWIWPKRQGTIFAQAYIRCRAAVVSYLNTAVTAPSGPAISPSRLARTQAYASLADSRAHLAKCLADPPPVHSEAAAWLPAFASLTRMCDAITQYAATVDRKPTMQIDDWEQTLAPLAAPVLAQDPPFPPKAAPRSAASPPLEAGSLANPEPPARFPSDLGTAEQELAATLQKEVSLSLTTPVFSRLAPITRQSHDK